MIKDFIGPNKKENFFELIPSEDFYTSQKEIEQASKDENGADKPLDVVLSSVYVNEIGYNISTGSNDQNQTLDFDKVKAKIEISGIRTDSKGNVLNQRDEVLKCYTTGSINLSVKDATNPNLGGLVTLKGAALVYYKVTNEFAKALPGIPTNLSEEFGKDFINSKNMASRCNSIIALLFGKNRLSNEWTKSHIVFLTPKGAEKIHNAYEELRNSAKDEKSAPFYCSTELFLN